MNHEKIQRIMKYLNLTLVLLLLFSKAHSQSSLGDDQNIKKKIVDQEPIFSGGEENLEEFLRKNLVYPKKAIKLGVQGRVFISCDIDKDGTLSNIKLLRGVHPLLNEEAIRLVNLMPKWNSAIKNDNYIKYNHSISINFSIKDWKKNKKYRKSK